MPQQLRGEGGSERSNSQNQNFNSHLLIPINFFEFNFKNLVLDHCVIFINFFHLYIL